MVPVGGADEVLCPSKFQIPKSTNHHVKLKNNTGGHEGTRALKNLQVKFEERILGTIRSIRERQPVADLVVGLVDGSPIANVLSEAGFEVTHNVAAQDTLKTLDGEQNWGVVFVSDALGKPALQSIIDRSASTRPPSPVVVVGTDNHTSDNLAASVRQLGAADFIGPPFTLEALESKLRHLHTNGAGDPASAVDHLGLVGSSPAMAKVKECISRIARYRTDVLLLGENGAGKEAVARALHEMGPRRQEPFLTLTCAGSSREALESELFGSEGGNGKGDGKGLLD